MPRIVSVCYQNVKAVAGPEDLHAEAAEDRVSRRLRDGHLGAGLDLAGIGAERLGASRTSPRCVSASDSRARSALGSASAQGRKRTQMAAILFAVNPIRLEK